MLGSVRDEGADLHVGDPASLYLVDPDPAAVLERAVGAGAEPLRPVEETDFGSRQCSLRDPAGNTWTVGTYGGAGPA